MEEPPTLAGRRLVGQAGGSRPAAYIRTSQRKVRNMRAFLAFRAVRLVRPIAADLGLSKVKRRSKKSTTGTHYSGWRAYGDGLRFPIGIRRERYLVAGSGLMTPPLSGPRQHPNVLKKWRVLFRSENYFGIVGN